MTPIRSLILAAALITLTACSAGFPRGSSTDWDITTSQGHNQWRVAIQDTITGQELWAIDVPDGQSLVIDLATDNYRKPTQTGSLPAESLKWDLFDIDGSVGTLSNTLQLPGNPVLIRKTLRTPDSQPATYEQPIATTPAPNTTESNTVTYERIERPAPTPTQTSSTTPPASSTAAAPAAAPGLSADDAP